MNTLRNLPGKIWVSIASLDPLLRGRARRAGEALSVEERELFLSMPRYDLAHSLAVAYRFSGEPVLYKAALLHDAGKLRPELGLFTRWLYTSLEIFLPSLLRKMTREVESDASGEAALERARSLPEGWRSGFYMQLHHAEICADILSDLGSDEEIIRLVGGHQSEPTDELSERLRKADDTF